MGSEIAFVIALVVALVAIYWIILKNSSEKISEQYRQLAQALELELDQPPAKLGGLLRPDPAAFGQYQGREISVSVPGKGLQKTQQIETVLKVGLSDKQFRAQITAAGLLGKVRQRDSGDKERWDSGDAEFNAAVDIRTNQGDRLIEILDPRRRTFLTEALKKPNATIYIGDGTMAYVRRGLLANETTRKEFESVAQFFCDLAETLES